MYSPPLFSLCSHPVGARTSNQRHPTKQRRHEARTSSLTHARHKLHARVDGT